MSEQSVKEQTIGEIVANDFRAAHIFKEAGIDFCCGGNKSVSQACNEKGVDKSQLLREIEDLSLSSPGNHMNFKEWEPGFLSDYIVNTHHKFVRKNLPELVFYTGKIAAVHGAHHPELLEVEALFSKISEELTLHLDKEEEVLFPAVKEAEKQPSELLSSVIVSEIERMQGEHEFAGGAMDKINILTQKYRVPEDACNTYRVALRQLEAFEDDLHIHVHLENNILYPAALKLANQQ